MEATIFDAQGLKVLNETSQICLKSNSEPALSEQQTTPLRPSSHDPPVSAAVPPHNASKRERLRLFGYVLQVLLEPIAWDLPEFHG